MRKSVDTHWCLMGCRILVSLSPQRRGKKSTCWSSTLQLPRALPRAVLSQPAASTSTAWTLPTHVKHRGQGRTKTRRAHVRLFCESGTSAAKCVPPRFRSRTELRRNYSSNLADKHMMDTFETKRRQGGVFIRACAFLDCVCRTAPKTLASKAVTGQSPVACAPQLSCTLASLAKHTAWSVCRQRKWPRLLLQEMGLPSHRGEKISHKCARNTTCHPDQRFRALHLARKLSSVPTATNSYLQVFDLFQK